MLFKGYFLFLDPTAILLSRADLSNFGTESSKLHFCEIILKSAHWPSCRFTNFSIFSSGGHFVQRSRTILAILIKGHPRNVPVKLF